MILGDGKSLQGLGRYFVFFTRLTISDYTFREEMHGDGVDNDVLITHFQVLF